MYLAIDFLAVCWTHQQGLPDWTSDFGCPFGYMGHLDAALLVTFTRYFGLATIRGVCLDGGGE